MQLTAFKMEQMLMARNFSPSQIALHILEKIWFQFFVMSHAVHVRIYKYPAWQTMDHFQENIVAIPLDLL